MKNKLIAYYNHFVYQYGYHVYYNDIRSVKSETFQEQLRKNHITYEWDNTEDRANWSTKSFEVFFTDNREAVERIILENCDFLIDWTVPINGRIKVYSLNEKYIEKLANELRTDGYYTNEAILDDKIVYEVNVYGDLQKINRFTQSIAEK